MFAADPFCRSLSAPTADPSMDCALTFMNCALFGASEPITGGDASTAASVVGVSRVPPSPRACASVVMAGPSTLVTTRLLIQASASELESPSWAYAISAASLVKAPVLGVPLPIGVGVSRKLTRPAGDTTL